jgi:hypothetical protein
MRGLVTGVATLALVVVVAAAPAAAPPRVILGDTVLGGLRLGHATPPQAVKQLGKPTVLRQLQPTVCRGIWQPLGLTTAFLSLSGRPPCTAGALLTATITSRAAWRTAVGLRVGDPVARVKALYPRSSLRGSPSGYWLITRRTCKVGGSLPYPSLLARVLRGRVSALVVATTACE